MLFSIFFSCKQCLQKKTKKIPHNIAYIADMSIKIPDYFYFCYSDLFDWKLLKFQFWNKYVKSTICIIKFFMNIAPIK